MSEARHRPAGSLIERAATIYDFDAAFRAREGGSTPPPPPIVSEPVVKAAPRSPGAKRSATIDPARLAEQGLLVPGAPIGSLAEEFRLAKRQLLLGAQALQPTLGDRARAILVTSPAAHDGKTYCALNLALSIAAERDTQVLLVDADVAKPDILGRLGVDQGPGLLDALADPAIAIEDIVIASDVPHLSLLPAGARSTEDTELLASGRTAELLGTLLAADPRRIILFDSPPVLAASPAATLALHVGQTVVVVRADRTSESELAQAVALLDGCDRIQLLLNAVSLAPRGRRMGSYYGMEDA